MNMKCYRWLFVVALLLAYMGVSTKVSASREPIIYGYVLDEDSIADADTLSTSTLLMPNAFSPNGDGINDIYKAKSGHQGITDFHAYIYNRWGQKLFEWTDVDGGWDGTYKGKPVKQGVYFVLVKAKGSDGKTYNIKRDVNLLRGYSEYATETE